MITRKIELITVAIICVGIGISSLNVAYGGEPAALHPELKKVKQYAPIIWLATDEPLYPMMPHPFAFDGKDNNGNELIDLQDPDEVGIFEVDKEGWYKLAKDIEELKIREKRDKKKGLPPARVIYTNSDGPVMEGFHLFQYWFYYVFDQGIGAHVHDGEHAFVFVEPGSGAVKCIVAAGHTGASANNILAIN